MKQNFFADLLAPLKKDSLLDEADFLFFKVPLKMTKDKIVSAIAKHVVDEPEVWLYHLVEYDLRMQTELRKSARRPLPRRLQTSLHR